MPQSRRSVRRAVAVAAGLSAIAAMVAVTSAPTAAPAAAATTSTAQSSAVVSGQARFEVLSPTLIRTEYAGDAQFVDAPTFNAIGRDGFASTAFTTSTTDGWLSISTAALTLRYKVDSGAFTEKNLTVALKNGQQQVTANPWPAPARCAVGVLCEAEALPLNGATLATDHGGYTGRGFAAGFASVGNSLSFQTEVSTAGSYQLDVRYANSTGGDGKNTTRTLSVSVDGAAPVTLNLPPTGSWDNWGLTNVGLTLSAGTHTVTVTHGANDSGNVNIDSLALVTAGASFPAPTPPASAPCAFGTVCEADSGTMSDGARLASDHNGYSGAGFVAGLEHTGASVALQVTGVPAAGTYALQLRYANAKAGAQSIQDRTVSVSVGSAAATTATLPPTSSWDAWRIVSVPVTLAAGDNTVTLGCPTANSCNVNLDTVALTSANGPLLAPHAPLGGYRRGLDGVDAGAITTPGLLYQDGWSLLDDSPSAIFNPSTHTVTPRPDHGGKAYQDGYIFGYGQDYPQGLQDLATLTGPPKLLPRWTYGVWYSEYYDRTAADYQNVIVPRFRSEGVPLDVLVIDTDFKSPNQWNGWEIDRSKFPDPAAFFAWAHSQGLHDSLNIHPSILAADPQFAQAQATAKGKLQHGYCSGGGADCYVFDFGDPDQLKAYLDLHQTMEKQGTDFWWLDWCCDGSQSSAAGVTPDSWINQAYADDTVKQIGRGFAFSRAYGSLQAGGYGGPVGVPTGPWADKRNTLHFTGDTISDWATLQFEVGYTPGESAATGMASISHDIGGHTNGLQEPGTEPGSTKLPDDLYARWVQFGTFQPIDRLHSNHSDRLPWQYGTAAKDSAEKFLNLRENLLPYTYTLAHESNTTGVPIVRPLYLQYPDQQEAYAQDDAEYLYGPDVLVAPVTTPGSSATTSVWFPAGSSWTDWFTGKTYQGGTTAKITTDLNSMPVFVRSGGMVVTRSANVTNDVQNPLTAATVTVASGDHGSSSFSLYEDDGTSTDPAQSSTTAIRYVKTGHGGQVLIDPAVGSFSGQVDQRAWTVTFLDATAPTVVSVNGHDLPATSWQWDSAQRKLTVTAPTQSVHKLLKVSYR